MKEKMTDKHSYAIKMLLFFITSCGKALSLLRQFKSDCILRRDSALSSFNSSAFIVATRYFVATVKFFVILSLSQILFFILIIKFRRRQLYR